MPQLKSNTPVRVADLGVSDNWSVFASGVTGDVEVEIAPDSAGPWVVAETITEAGAHSTQLSRNYWVKVDTANASEVWVV